MWRGQPNMFQPAPGGAAFFLEPAPRAASPFVRSPSSSSSHAIATAPTSVPTSVPISTFHVCPNSAVPPDPHLLRRYAAENERLRDQLRAHAVHAALLERRLQELSARGTALRLQDMRRDECDTALRARLDASERELSALRILAEERRGRIAALEEALIHNKAKPQLEPDESDHEGLRDQLRDALSGVGFLTRVCNAVEHCDAAPHGGAECPRSREDCEERCLRAAARGNAESAADAAARAHGASCEALARAVREEIGFCERAAVRIAARWLARRAEGKSMQRQEERPMQRQEERPMQRQEERPMPMQEERPVKVKEERPVKRKEPRPKAADPCARPQEDDCEVQ